MSENITFFINDHDDDNKTVTNSSVESQIFFNNGNEENSSDNINIFDYQDIICNNLATDYQLSKEIDYEMNYTVNQLLLICEYYDLVKEWKLKKCNKQTIIQILVNFENNADNIEIVSKRKLFWRFMEELKNDKFMKRFIIW